MIEVSGLVVEFGSLRALKGIDFRVGERDIFGFIGPNGAGKTTTIRVISTLLHPTEGSVRVGGRCVVNEPEEVRRIIGFMPDSYGLYDDISVFEYLDFFAKAFGILLPKRKRVVDDVMALTDLGGLRDRQVSTLSRGMRQRLCMAKTLVHDPPVLVLDEPASGLDPRARIEFRELLKELRSMGKTILISSHILTELADFCTSVGIIESGSMVAWGGIDEVMKRLKPAKIVRILIQGRPAEAQEAMKGLGFVDRFEAFEGHMDVFLRPDCADVPALVKALVMAGVPVSGVAERGASLEDLFIAITEGKVC